MGDFLKAILAFMLLGVALYVLFYVGIIILAIGLLLGFFAYAVAFWSVKFRKNKGLEEDTPPGTTEAGFIEGDYTEVPADEPKSDSVPKN